MILGKIEITHVARKESHAVGQKLVEVEAHATSFFSIQEPIRQIVWVMELEDQPKVGDVFYVWLSHERDAKEAGAI